MGNSGLFCVLLAAIFLTAPDRAAPFEDDLELQARLTPCELIRYHGYPCDIAYATTEDGYVLQVNRVPFGVNSSGPAFSEQENVTCRRHPVVLLPPFLTASDVYFLNFPWQSVGFLLADAGFDVWSMNSREAKQYSNHTTLSQDDPKYWKFSFDEIGRFDAAATVNLILNVTGCPNVTILGTSQGTAAAFVLLSTRPEFNNKVNLLCAYGPVANLTYMASPLSLLLPLVPVVAPVVDIVTGTGYLGTSADLRQFLSAACEIALQGEICSLVFTLSTFTSPYQFNETREPMYIGHVPTGITTTNLRHYSQIYRKRNFVMYDHGATENKKRYGQITPPPYPLERIRTRVALFSSPGDNVADPRDVQDLAAKLGSSAVLRYVVPQETFRHLDYAIGCKAKDILHDVAIETIRKYAP